jgi:hypothetical protein
VVLEKDGADHVRKEVLHRAKEERNIQKTIKRGNDKWSGHILRRNCILKHVIEGNMGDRIEVKGRRGRKRKELVDDCKETAGYWKLKQGALYGRLWGIRFGKSMDLS